VLSIQKCSFAQVCFFMPYDVKVGTHELQLSMFYILFCQILRNRKKFKNIGILVMIWCEKASSITRVRAGDNEMVR
jgi:hypothetical protein